MIEFSPYFQIGLFRSISEFFGPTGGAALIFTASGILASLFFGLCVRDIPRIYLWCGGALFVDYEASLALSIGLAHSRVQSCCHHSRAKKRLAIIFRCFVMRY